MLTHIPETLHAERASDQPYVGVEQLDLMASAPAATDEPPPLLPGLADEDLPSQRYSPPSASAAVPGPSRAHACVTSIL